MTSSDVSRLPVVWGGEAPIPGSADCPRATQSSIPRYRRELPHLASVEPEPNCRLRCTGLTRPNFLFYITLSRLFKNDVVSEPSIVEIL